MYKAETNKIEIIVKPAYVPNNKAVNQYFWTYNVFIYNNRKSDIKLISRKWNICNATGHVVTVEGDGVIGKRPTIKSGEYFNYSSFTNLNSKSGIMFGNYQFFELDTNKIIIAKIPPFILEIPGEHYYLN